MILDAVSFCKIRYWNGAELKRTNAVLSCIGGKIKMIVSRWATEDSMHACTIGELQNQMAVTNLEI